jgi:SOS-response transcriptional repressor LexA
MMAHDTLCIAQVNTHRIATARIVVDMSAGTSKAERLREARMHAGFSSATEAAERFGWGVSGYRHHENGTRDFGADSARKYGRAFRVKPAWLLGLEKINDLPLNLTASSADQLEVNGSVCAGVWRESEQWNDERRFVINLPSPIAGARRFGLVVEGSSMDLFYEQQTVLDCVSIFDRDVKPSNGDHVIVERIRADGLRELTVKEYREEGEGDARRFLLVPRSSNPRFTPLEYPGPDKPGDKDPASGELVQVIAFVVASYPPRVLGLMRRMRILTTPTEMVGDLADPSGANNERPRKRVSDT